MEWTDITVFGGADAGPGDGLWNIAEHLGEALARAGFRVVNGGYGGTMEAAARGARKAGGEAVGVIVSCFSRPPNAFLTETIVADTLFQRLEILLNRGRGYVVLPGSTGTLVELALALELTAKRILPERPIVLLGQFWEPVIQATLNPAGDAVRITSVPASAPPVVPPNVHRVDTVDEAVARLTIVKNDNR